MRAREFVIEAPIPMDPSRRGFLKRAAGTAAAGAAMSAAGPQITALVTNFVKETGGMTIIQALKEMLKVATADEIYNMYDYYADTGIMEDGITDDDMLALKQSDWANRPDVKSWMQQQIDDGQSRPGEDWSWYEFQEWCNDNDLYPDEEFERITGRPLKMTQVLNIIEKFTDEDITSFFDDHPGAMYIITPDYLKQYLTHIEPLENIDVAAKQAQLPTRVVTAANTIAGFVRQLFKSNGKPLTAPQPVKAAPALPAPTQPEIELPVDIKQKQAEPVRRQGNGQDQLTEFDPGEGGFGPFKVYHEDYFVEQFPTFEEAMGEIDFRRNADPKSATHHWRIVDGTGETVWEYDIGDDIDAYRRSQKFQRRS
jgi:hypothetical protein